jgi:hypothetical protein
MSSSLQNEGLIPATGDRRLFSRKKLPQVVLVFFAHNGWGRLVNISENGMAFEFSGLSDVGQVISFELADLTQNSIQVDGRIIWTHDLDKIAGVQFVDLTPESRQQIRQWLSSGRFTHTRLHDENQRQASQLKALEETKPPLETESPDDIKPHVEIKPPEETKPPAEIQPPDAFKPADLFKPVDEFKPLEPPPKREKAPARSNAGLTSLVPEPRPEKEPIRPKVVDQHSSAQPPERNPRGLNSLVPEPRPEKPPARPKVAEQQQPQPEKRIPRGVTSLVPQPRPESRPEPRPELPPEPRPETPPEPVTKHDPSLEIWDDYFNRAHVGLDKPPIAWTRVAAALFTVAVFGVLSFLAGIWTARYRQSRAEQAQEISLKAANTAASANNAARPFEVEVVDAKNKRWSLTFAPLPDKRVVPPAPRAASGSSTSPVAPVSRSQTVASKNAQEPPQKPSTPSGQIEPARLISSISPAYPAAARSQNIAGDVVIDALVDSTGKVADMNVVSGPILLRQPAMESVRMSKYSPAHLDGRPVPTHLLVTVRFAKP